MKEQSLDDQNWLLPGDKEYNKARKVKNLRRLVWEHANSGSITITGTGLASTNKNFILDDTDWLNSMFTELHFTLQEWDGDYWVEVAK